MEKMPGHPRLYRREATYYHRAAIPVDIKNTYPKSEETFSLGTKDHAEAVRLVRVAAADIDRKFDAHRKHLAQQDQPPLSELSDSQIKQIGEVYHAFLMEEDEEVRLDGFHEENGPLPPLPVKSFEGFVEDNDAEDEGNRFYQARGKADGFYKDEAEEVLTWDNVNLRLSPQSQSWPKLARELQAASIRAAEVARSRNKGDIIETPKTAGLEPGVTTPMLSQAVEEWAQEKSRTTWVPKTEHEHRIWTGHFITLTGDKPLSQYSKADGRAFKSMLLKLPANWNKKGAIRGRPIDKAAIKAHELGMSPMSDRNVNKLIGFVGSFWTWADKHYDDVPANPFRGLKVKLGKLKVRDERNPFTLGELQAIFSAPLYTGCKSVREWASPGATIPRDAGIFWVPLVSLFTGTRSGEAIQLYVDDVREEDGIWYLGINDEGEDKRLKTAHSHRVVPIHQTLIELGFLQHVKLRKVQGEQRLFPDLKMGADGYYSSPFSKHFNRFLKAMSIKNRRNAFHSFRHCFEDACRDSGISKEVMDALQGHGEAGMSGRYGRGYVLKKLAEAMKTLRYRDLNLSHLMMK
jgi:integrase